MTPAIPGSYAHKTLPFRSVTTAFSFACGPADIDQIQQLHTALGRHTSRCRGGDARHQVSWQRAGGKGLVGVIELGAVGELDHAAHVVEGALFHAGHVEADGTAELASWLRPGGEPIGSVEAKLHADIGGGRRRDRILGHLHVLGRGKHARGDDIDRRSGGFGGIGFARRGDHDEQALRTRGRSVIAGGIDGASRGGSSGGGVDEASD